MSKEILENINDLVTNIKKIYNTTQGVTLEESPIVDRYDSSKNTYKIVLSDILVNEKEKEGIYNTDVDDMRDYKCNRINININYNNNEVRIPIIFVLEKRNGTATMILKEIEKFGLENGIETIKIVSVQATNTPMISFCEKHNFIEFSNEESGYKNFLKEIKN